MRLTQALLSACLLLPGAVAAGSLHVPDQYPTITEAVADAVAGDTVWVSPGNYTNEALRIGSGVAVASTEGRTATKIRARQGASALEFLPGTEPSLVRGFRVSSGPYDYQPPVIVGSNPNMIVEDCAIWGSGPIDWYDPGIVLYNGGTFRNCEIENGHEFHMFWLVNPGAQLLVEDCVLGRNLYPEGMDNMPSGASLLFRNCTLSRSEIDPAVYHYDENPTDFSVEFENCILDACYIAPEGGDHLRPDVLEFRYSCKNLGLLYLPQGGWGPGNIEADPLLCEPVNWGEDTPYEAWLEPDSPCIGIGLGGENIGARYGICGVSGVEDPLPGISSSTLRAWPNPARGQVWIELASPVASPTAVEVVDVLGRRVATLPASPGARELEWDTRDALGEDVPAGVYLLRLLPADAQVPGASASATRLTVIR